MFKKLITSQKEAVSSILLNSNLKELLAGSTIAFVFSVLGVGTGYVFAYLVSHTYGTRGMGIYSLSYSVLVVLEMFGTLGFKSSVLRYAGQFYGEKDFGAIRSLYRQMFRLSAPVSLVFSAGIGLVSYQLATVLFHDPALVTAFRIASLAGPFYVLNAVNVEWIRGLRNIPLSEYLRGLNRPIFSILSFLGLSLVLTGLYVPVFSLSLALASTFVISSIYLFKKLRAFPKVTESRVSDRELLRVSFPMMVTSFSFLIMGYLDTLMLGMFSTTGNVGIYNIAVRLASLTSFILFALNVIASPKFAELYWSNRREDLVTVVRFTSKLAFWFSFPILLVYLLFPSFFMGIFGAEFAKGRYALVFLALGQFMNATAGLVGPYLNMTGKQKAFRNIVILAALIDIVLCYLLIPRLGINGAAIATMTSLFFWNISSVIVIKKVDRINTFYFPVFSS
jgi:O-antigen/teichoic acid export membrane protein